MFRWHGIKKYYPLLHFLPIKLRAYVVNSRPLTLALPLVGGFFIIHASVPGLSFFTLDPLKIILALLVLALINAGGNNINAAFDYRIDEINKPYRPIPRGLITIKESVWFGSILVSVAVLLSLIVNPLFVLLVCVLAAATILYSAPPFRFKTKLWINNGWQALTRGVIGVLAAWSVYGGVNLQTAAISATLFMFILAAQTSKDFPDVKGDGGFGVRTLPVVYGPEAAAKIVKLMLPGPFVVLLLTIVLGMLPMTGLVLLILAIPTAYLAKNLRNIENLRVENNRSWVTFYICMLGFLVGFSLIL